LVHFSPAPAADIAANLKSLCSRDEWDRIEVLNLDAWVRRFLEKQSFVLKLAYDEGENLWQKALAMLPPELALTSDFVRSEWNNVVQAQGVDDLSGYLRVSRVGRTRRLSRTERQQLWSVFGEYRALLNEQGLCEPADAFRTAVGLIRDRGITFPYQAVVVDEAQDFGNEAFRLLRALVPAGANDLFIVGDAHQRIYGHQVVLSRCDIDIRGRGKKLRINYRTTEEVKNWAIGLLKGYSFDDLDAGVDDTDAVRSIVNGEPPVVKACSGVTEAADLVCSHITQLLQGESAPPETICLVARTHYELEAYEKYVRQVCPTIHQIEPGKADDGTKPGIRLATIHRVKGLEFDHMIIAGALDDFDTPSSDSTEKITANRALLYVAATRARKSLLVCRIIKKAIKESP